MSRIQIEDEFLEDVTGGNIQYVNANGERYMWGSHSPDQKYSFASKTAVRNFIQANYDELGERGCLQEMVAQGIIVPIPNTTPNP